MRRHPPLVLRHGRLRGTYRRRLWSLLFLALFLAALWLVSTVRLLHGIPVPMGFGDGGGGWPPPDGDGVREPRRPLPMSPAGAAALPIPDESPGLAG
jgi:hypothetical protein